MVPLVQLVRASDCGSECHGFESHRAPKRKSKGFLFSFISIRNKIALDKPYDLLNLRVQAKIKSKHMKKLIYTVLMTAAIVGCQEVKEELRPVEKGKSFKAEIENLAGQTKTYMDSDRNILWAEGDEIAVFQNNSVADKYKVSSETVGTTEGEFTIVSDNSESTNTEGIVPTDIVAVYPYADGLTITKSESDETLTTYELTGIFLPQTQAYDVNSFGTGTFPMAAVAEGLTENSLKFKNMLGAIKIQLKGTETVKSIQIQGNSKEKLAGEATVVVYSNTYTPDLLMGESAKTSVTLDCGEGVKLSETTATSFIIALPPVIFSKGFTVTVTDTESNKQTLRAHKALEIQRSKVLVMPVQGENDDFDPASLTVEFGEQEVTRTSMKVQMNAPGAQGIYYRFDATSRPGKINTQAKQEEFMLTYGTYISASSGEAFIDKLKPKTPKVLIAMPVNADGKFGKMTYTETLTTDPLEFNNLTVTIDAEHAEISDKKASFPISISGGTATDIIFWVGKKLDEFWTLTEYCDGSAESGEKYMALYPEDSNIQKAMSQHTYANGKLQLTGLGADKDYVILFMAKDASGNYSHAGFHQFKTMAANLGTIVRTGSDTWNAAKEKIQIKWHENKFRLSPSQNLFAFYAFDFSCPSDLTAYVGCLSEEYYYGSGSPFSKVEDIIIDMEAFCSRRYHSGTVRVDSNGEYAQEPDWVDDNGDTHTGTLLNVYDFYVHGFPTSGFVTYFATGSHGANNCTYWETECTEYQYALNAISNYCSLDYWKDYVRTQRANYCKKEEVINKCATDLYNAYYPHYKDAKPLIYENNGSALYMEHHEATGPDDKGNVIDDVIVVLKDKDGNYYEPMIFEVPNYFK